MTTAEMMAIAVLKGDMVAARGLADLLMEEYNTGNREIVPVRKFNKGKTKALVYMSNDAPPEAIRRAMNDVAEWMRRKSAVLVVNETVKNIEFYEMNDHE